MQFIEYFMFGSFLRSVGKTRLSPFFKLLCQATPPPAPQFVQLMPQTCMTWGVDQPLSPHRYRMFVVMNSKIFCGIWSHHFYIQVLCDIQRPFNLSYHTLQLVEVFLKKFIMFLGGVETRSVYIQYCSELRTLLQFCGLNSVPLGT